MKVTSNEVKKAGKPRQIIREYLSGKERKKLYEVSFYSPETLDERYILHPFSDGVLDGIKALRGRYGLSLYSLHLDEIFKENEFASCFLALDDITDIDIDNPRYEYLFRCYEYSDGELQSYDLEIEMTDNEYVELVSLCCEDKDLTFNKLRHVSNKLYDKLLDRIDFCFCSDNVYDCKYPYFVTMDEAKTDAEAIVKQHGELRHEDNFKSH